MGNVFRQRFGFVIFENEADAFNSFKKGETLKIAGSPVDVLYARQPDPAKTAPSPKVDEKTNAKELTNGNPAKGIETPGKVVSGKETPMKGRDTPKVASGKGKKEDTAPKTKASVHVDTPVPKSKMIPGKTQEAKSTPSKQGVVSTPAKKDVKSTPKLNGKSPALSASKGSLKPNGKVLAKGWKLKNK